MSQLKCKNVMVYFIQTTRGSMVSNDENCKKKKKEKRSQAYFTLYLFKTYKL